MNNEYEVNEKIKKYLEGNGITQTHVANKSGMSVKKINDIVKKRSRVHVDTLDCIAKALNVEPYIFLNDKSE